jgi:membrane protein implicated in regulation of membrane protease activity
MPAWAWAVLATLSGLGELHRPGSYLIWIAVGAALTAAIDAAFQPVLEVQIVAFLGISVLSCAGGYFAYGNSSSQKRRSPPLNQRNLMMIGMHGVAATPFVDGRGKVRLGDSVWLAEGADLPAGTAIVVRSVRGTTLIVEAVKPEKAGAPG